MMKLKSKGAALIAGLMLGTTALATTAFASPAGPGQPGSSFVPQSTNIAAGTLDGPVTIKQDDIKLSIEEGDATVRSFDLKYPVGTYSGWHRHPGIVVAVVQSGRVSRMLKDCTTVTFTAGQSFYETGAHFVWNPDPATDAVLKITQIYPANQPTRSEVDPLCPMPTIPPTLSPAPNL